MIRSEEIAEALAENAKSMIIPEYEEGIFIIAWSYRYQSITYRTNWPTNAVLAILNETIRKIRGESDSQPKSREIH